MDSSSLKLEEWGSRSAQVRERTWHVALAARFVPKAGWIAPVETAAETWVQVKAYHLARADIVHRCAADVVLCQPQPLHSRPCPTVVHRYMAKRLPVQPVSGLNLV